MQYSYFAAIYKYTLIKQSFYIVCCNSDIFMQICIQIVIIDQAPFLFLSIILSIIGKIYEQCSIASYR